MKTLEELIQSVTEYENNQIANDWSIGHYYYWKGTIFSEIIDMCRRFGLNKNSTDTLIEIAHRVDDWATFTTDFEDSEGRLRKIDEACRVIDNSFNIGIHEAVFGNKTVEQILQQWKEEEEWEKEEEARQDCIDFCANFVYNDGLVDDLDEAYELAEMCCR